MPQHRFDVFMSHSSSNGAAVSELAKALRARGLKPWLDADELVSGTPFQPALAAGMGASACVAVFVGQEPVGAWVHEELDAAVDRAAKDRTFRVFLVLLPEAPTQFDPTGLHRFLSQRTWVDLRSTDDPDAAADQLARAVRGEPLGAPQRVVDPSHLGSPYVGLRPFEIDEAAVFFGRDADTQRMLEKLELSPFLAVLGRSGAGKSSVVRAGLLPALAAGEVVPGSQRWTVRVLRPSASPLETLAAHVSELRPDVGPVEILSQLATSDVALNLFTRARDDRAPVVWVVDQAEELFTLCHDAGAREAFAANLLHASQPGGPARVVVVLRSDFYPRFAELPAFGARIAQSQHLVSDLDDDQLESVVTGPAQLVGASLEPGLADRIIDDVRAQPGGLPLLQHALRELWDRRQGCVLTHAAYHEIGGVRGALAIRAEAAYEALDAAGDGPLARRLILELVRLGEGTEGDVRQPAWLYDLATPDHPIERLHRVAAALADARLMTTGALPSSTSATPRATSDHGMCVELSHDALVRSWPRLRSWIDESRDELRTRRRVREAAQAWNADDQPDDMLYRGTVLALVKSSLAQRAGDLSEVEADFLTTSTRLEDTARARVRRRRRNVLAALSSLTTLTLIAAISATSLAFGLNDARSDAVAARDEALSRETALNAEDLMGTDPGLAAQLAVAGYDIAPTVEARSAVITLAALPRSERQLGNGGPTALAARADGSVTASSDAVDGTVRLFTRESDRQTLTATIDTDATVHALAFAPDGELLVVGDDTGRITLWSVDDPTDPEPLGSPVEAGLQAVERLAVSPDGTELAAAGPGPGLRRWDIVDATVPRPLASVPSADTWSMAYFTDSTHLATSNEAGDVQLWHVAGTPSNTETLTTSGAPAFSVSVSPDGQLLTAGSRDGRLYVWDVGTRSGARPVEVSDARFGSWVNTTAFSPDGRYLLAGSSDLTLRVWDVGTWQPVATFPHPETLTNASFLGDPSTIVTTATDGTTRWWDLAAAVAPRIDGRMWGVSFDRSGALLATTSGIEARLWDASSGAPGLAPLSRVVDLDGAEDGLSGAGALSPDGAHLALGSRSTGEVYLVDVSAPENPVLAAEPLGGSRDLVEAVAFSPDGSMLAAGGDDEAIRIWTLDPPNQPTLVAHIEDLGGFVLSLAWSPDGRYLVAPSSERVLLFDVTDPRRTRQAAVLDGFEDDAWAATFSPDGRTLATGGPGDVVTLWDVTDPASPRRRGESLAGPAAKVNDLAFDRRGDYLAAALADGTTWLWRVSGASVGLRSVLSTADASMNQVEFDPDSGMLAAGDADGRLFLAQPDVRQAIADICARSGDPITEAEWNTYLPDTTYSPPCPR